MNTVSAIARRPDDSEVEIVLLTYPENEEAPLRIRAALPFFRRIWVEDANGNVIEVIKEGAAQ